MDVEEQISVACEDQGVTEPLSFLTSLMAGRDPRYNSLVWELVQTIEEENFGDCPNESQWEELISIVETSYKPKPVDITTSQKAATTLAEYRHPKRKSIELSSTNGAIDVPDLTETEFDLFEEWFSDQF